MNRAAFLTLYIIIALLLSGGLANPWIITVMALAYGQIGPLSLLSPVFIISVFSPVVLIVLAYMRGKTIGNSKLILFPIAALGLTLLPLLFGLLTKFLSGPGNRQPLESIGLTVTMLTAFALSLGPMILHTICCVLGGQRDSVTAVPTATKIEASKLFYVLLLIVFIVGGLATWHHTSSLFSWDEEVQLIDGRSLSVKRSASNDHPISHQTISFKSNGKVVTWEDNHKWPIDYTPHILDFVDSTPVIVLPVYRYGPCQEYGYPQEGLAAFRFRQNKWERMTIQELPNNLVVNLLESADELVRWPDYKGSGVTYELKKKIDEDSVGPQKQGTTLEALIRYYSTLGSQDSCSSIHPPPDSKRDVARAYNAAAIAKARTIQAALENVVTTPETLSNNDRYPKRGIRMEGGVIGFECKDYVERLEPMYEANIVGSTMNSSLSGYQFFLTKKDAINRQVQLPYNGAFMNQLLCNGNKIYAIARQNSATLNVYQFTDLGELQQAIKVNLPDAEKISDDKSWGDLWEIKLVNNELVIVLVDGGGNKSDVLRRKQIYRVQLQEQQETPSMGQTPLTR